MSICTVDSYSASAACICFREFTSLSKRFINASYSFELAPVFTEKKEKVS